MSKKQNRENTWKPNKDSVSQRNDDTHNKRSELRKLGTCQILEASLDTYNAPQCTCRHPHIPIISQRYIGRKEVRGMGSVRHGKEKIRKKPASGWYNSPANNILAFIATTMLQPIMIRIRRWCLISIALKLFVLHEKNLEIEGHSQSQWQISAQTSFRSPPLETGHLIEASNCVLACWHNYCTYTWYLPRA